MKTDCFKMTSSTLLILFLFGYLAHSQPINDENHRNTNPSDGHSTQQDDCFHIAELQYFECVRQINDGRPSRGKMAGGIMAERRIRFALCVNRFQHQNNGCRY